MSVDAHESCYTKKHTTRISHAEHGCGAQTRFVSFALSTHSNPGPGLQAWHCVYAFLSWSKRPAAHGVHVVAALVELAYAPAAHSTHAVFALCCALLWSWS